MAMAKNYFGITDIGKLRKNNEDTFIAQSVLNGRYIAACVIDGVGGYSGGEVAAQHAHDAILASLKASENDVIALMSNAFTAANETIYKEKISNKDNEQMACVVTLALADVENNKFYYAHVGDTRLYLLRDNSLVKITKDHSFVGFLEDSGRLTEDAAMRHPKRNEINKALGFDATVAADGYVETGDSPFLPGDVLLLCSDGLSDMVTNQAMTDILKTNKTLPDIGKALIRAANEAGGKDNITVVLVRNDKVPVKHESLKPAAVTLQKNEDDVAEVVPVSDRPEPKQPVRKKGSGAVPILSILCLLLLGAFLWLLYQGYHNKQTAQSQTLTAPRERQLNEQEQKLISDISKPGSSEAFVLAASPGQPITLSDTIFIEKDSLHIIGNGVTLLRDTSFAGPAFILSPNCKYILFDSLTLENFDVGIVSLKHSLQLRNVEFRNCVVPVQYQVGFEVNKRVSGTLDSFYYNTDSLRNN